MNNKGFTIIEVLIATALIGLGTFSLMLVIQTTTAMNQRQKVKMSALRLNLTLIDLVSLPSTIRATSGQSEVPGMEAVWQQIRGWEKSNHKGAYIPVPMFLPQVERIGSTGYVTGGQLTGTPATPMRYNLSGIGCDTASTTCLAEEWPIETFTEINFNCPPIFYRGYDNWLRGGFQFAGAIYPDGLAIPSACISKSDVNIRLTIRESTDPGSDKLEAFAPIQEIITIAIRDIAERQ